MFLIIATLHQLRKKKVGMDWIKEEKGRINRERGVG